MKYIELTKGYSTQVDNEDYENLSRYKWCAKLSRNAVYAVRNSSIKNGAKKRTIHMHREIMHPASGLVVDHINGDTLNNTKSNLRVCTHKENIRNARLHIDSNSGFRGVSFMKSKGKYRARITKDYVEYHLGLFSKIEDAVRARLDAEKGYHKEFAASCR